MQIFRAQETADPVALRNIYDGIEAALNAKGKEGEDDRASQVAQLTGYIGMLNSYVGLNELQVELMKVCNRGTTTVFSLGLLKRLREDLPQQKTPIGKVEHGLDS